MNQRQSLVSNLLKKDFDFKKLYDKHRALDERIQALDRRHYLSMEQQLEMSRLKKLKLQHKDRMEAILNRYDVNEEGFSRMAAGT